MSNATLHTNAGPISVELFDEDAPKTVENFRRLSSEVDAGLVGYQDKPKARPGDVPLNTFIR